MLPRDKSRATDIGSVMKDNHVKITMTRKVNFSNGVF